MWRNFSAFVIYFALLLGNGNSDQTFSCGEKQGFKLMLYDAHKDPILETNICLFILCYSPTYGSAIT